jgi:hypothetical protein
LAVQIRTGRGNYKLRLAGAAEKAAGWVIFTLSLERADGIERVVFRCRVAEALLAPGEAPEAGAMPERIASWVEREFEQTREAALKSIRSERKLYEVVFDGDHRGPWA